MPEPSGTPGCPVPRSRVVDLYFMEHRAKVVDVAAFLDRLDRAEPDGTGEDFRVAALRAAIGVLQEPGPGRARRVLELLSDHTTEPAAAATRQGAWGADPGATA